MSVIEHEKEPLQIGDSVWIFTSRLYETTSTVIATPGEIIVVDPNWLPEEVAHIRAFVDHIRNARKLVLLFTHSDYDHIIGYGAFEPDIVIASAAFKNKINKSDDVQGAIRSDESYGVSRAYPLSYPSVDVAADSDGYILHLSATTLTFYLAPGHTREGIFTMIEPHGILIAGDYFSDVEFPLVSDLHAYSGTLAKLEVILGRHDVKYLIPGHGTIAEGHELMYKRQQEAIEYLTDVQQVTRGIPFPTEVYRKRYPNWDELLSWHDENIQKQSDVQ